MSDALVVVQARTGSSRLPGKVLMELGGVPMLAFQLRRLRPLGERIVVATSDLPGDDAIVEVAEREGADVIRGSEGDVLGRFATVLAAHPNAGRVVRLTADCPLTDRRIVRAVLDLLDTSGVDYASNVHPRSFPKGLDVEACTAEALRTAATEAADPYDREHVTPFLYRSGRFAVANLDSGRELGERWWTVDTAADLETVRAMVDAACRRGVDVLEAPWTDFVELDAPV